ncbi:MAG TPA: hypothetical protein VHX44_14390 [Planctomycetota bacterium]|nr:hypothetical protein [Planctomycetota bacterium]
MFSARNTMDKMAGQIQGTPPPPPSKGAQMAATGAAPDATPFPAGTSTMLTSSQGLAGLGDTTKKQLLGS